MKKIYYTVFSVILINTSPLVNALPTYVIGTIEEFNEGDFTQTHRYSYSNGNVANSLEIKIPVVGDVGQELIFDIDAHIEGEGYYDIGYECTNLIHVGEGVFMPVPGSIGSCLFESVAPSDEFTFEVELSAYCSGTYIGSDIDNRNVLLQESYVESIRAEAQNLLGNEYGALFPKIYDDHRDMNLLLDNRLSINGYCEELTITIEGNKTFIDKIDLDVLIAEPF